MKRSEGAARTAKRGIYRNLREAKPVETVKQVLNIGLFLSELVSR